MIFIKVQERFDKARYEWAMEGGALNWYRLLFWQWLYGKQTIANYKKHKKEVS